MANVSVSNLRLLLFRREKRTQFSFLSSRLQHFLHSRSSKTMPTDPCTVILGRIHTMLEERPFVEAVCASKGRILCMGSREEVLAFASSRQYSVTDTAGSHIYPGFIDSHSHLSGYSGMIDDVFCGLSCGSIANILSLLKKQAEKDEGDWVLGYGYDDTGLPECRHLTREELDSVSSVKPVLVRHVSLHFAYANSMALRMLGFDASTQIDGGEIVLDEHGLPSGLITEAAAFRAFSEIPTPSLEQTKKNIRKAMLEYNKQGVTSFVDSGIGILGDAETVVTAYGELSAEGAMTARAWLQATTAVSPLWDGWLAGISSDPDFLRLGGVKLFADGSIQAFTAALKQDYFTRPGWKGSFVDGPEDLERMICTCNEEGKQVAVHANGDAAIEAALCAFEKAFSTLPRPELHHTIVHAQTASWDQLARMKSCGVLPTLFPVHIDLWGDRHLKVFLGPERASRLNPAGDCVRLGLPFGLHVDTPVTPPAVLRNIQHAVTRRTSSGLLLGEEQRISIGDALKAYTVHAAKFCWSDQMCGVLRPGAFADMVCLDRELLEMPPEHVGNVGVKMTICGGQVVYQA